MHDSKLLFIVSQPRSGSTLLQALLSNNALVGTVSEPWLLLPFLGYHKKKLNKSIYNSDLASMGIAEFQQKIGRAEFNQDLAQFLLKQYEKILKDNEEFVLDKTPRYYEILDEIKEIFPNAKIIVLKRNPFAVVSSIIKTWDSNDINKLLEFKRDILCAPILLHNFSEKYKNDPNVRTLHYESVVRDPQKEIKSLYDWCGIKYETDYLNYSANIKFQGLMGDPVGINKDNVPNKQSLDKWQRLQKDNFWINFFNGYASYLSSNFLKEYGNYDDIDPKPTKIFDRYLQKANWNFVEHEIPKKQVAKNFFLRYLGFTSY